MRMSRRSIAAFGFGSATMLAVARVFRPALAADEVTPGDTVTAFRRAMMASDGAAFDALCAAQMSYGFTLTGETESEHKVTAVNIGVLMVWQKQGHTWKLLARQGFKVDVKKMGT